MELRDLLWLFFLPVIALLISAALRFAAQNGYATQAFRLRLFEAGFLSRL